ncbi:MAG: DNA alkylation repair protein [Actinomycetota bacterium]
MEPERQVTTIRAALEAVADPERVESMTRYMRDQFPFLGVTSPELRQAIKPLLAEARSMAGDDLVALAHHLWAQPEREFQYVGTLVLRRAIAALEARHLDDVATLITSKSWWDTVDSLAAWSVGPLVRANPELASTMDAWIDHDDIWLARTAILHQLSYKGDTDADRLFFYAERRAADTEFFIRKAIGWALRQYAREEPDRVRSFVEANRGQLSGLTVREAMKHLG